MANRILAESTPATIPGVAVTHSTHFDEFTGTAAALTAAGIVTPEQLQPQRGRYERKMIFLPNGQPSPLNHRGWREPGYKVVWRLDGGLYQVNITVAKDVQASRRKAEREAEHEREQLRINQAIAESGHQYRDWKLLHGFSGLPGGPLSSGSGCEWWEGTKAQLQAFGIGVGMVFPGEPGGPEDLYCKCPLGFDVRVYLPTYDRAKAAAGIYKAMSPYLTTGEKQKQYVQHAPGVMLQVWNDTGWISRDFYSGTDTALVAAGLVPSLDLFPGRPGKNKMQATYRPDWSLAGCSPRVHSTAVSIRRVGKGNKFCVEVGVGDAEVKRREAVREQLKAEREKRERALAVERQRLRQLASGTTVEDFRAKREEELERWTELLWHAVFGRPDGVLSYDLPEGSEHWDELADAFQTLRDVVREASVCRDTQLEAKLVTQQKLAAARNDKGLQSLLQTVKSNRIAD